MKKLNIKLMVIFSLVVIALGGIVITVHNDTNADHGQTTNVQQPAKTNKISISQDNKTISYKSEVGKTALETLKSLTAVETEQSSYGEFVTSINGTKAISGKQFWSFYVNGQMASEGAGTYKSTASELIEWKLEEIK